MWQTLGGAMVATVAARRLAVTGLVYILDPAHQSRVAGRQRHCSGQAVLRQSRRKAIPPAKSASPSPKKRLRASAVFDLFRPDRYRTGSGLDPVKSHNEFTEFPREQLALFAVQVEAGKSSRSIAVNRRFVQDVVRRQAVLAFPCIGRSRILPTMCH